MNIHEYQAKALLADFGVAVPRGEVAFTAAEATAAAARLEGPVWVVKAQIHAGGRGKGGGVKVTHSRDEAAAAAAAMLGMTLITPQTGPQGREVKRVYIEDGCDIARELYLGMLIDRGAARVTFIASTEGGMDIEQVAAATPHKIVKVPVDPATGIRPFHGRKLAFALGLEGPAARAVGALAHAMYRLFTERDAGLVEINPLVVTAGGALMAVDAKINFDANGLFRRPDIMRLRDHDEEDPAEVEAGEHQLSYIKLDGTIGCMVNGAGLAMATMDIIQHYGGAPANFLDVGGGATTERVTAAFKIILSDTNVRCLLVNIFGGILRCDVIADGIIAAAREVQLRTPLVVRLAGTNVAEGKALLEASGLPILAAENLDDAAQKAVQAAQAAQTE